MATPVNKNAEINAGRSPKLSMPMARAPRMTVKLSHDRKVRSLAKKTLGSTRVGRAMRLPVFLSRDNQSWETEKMRRWEDEPGAV